jgi:hypothetical protein
MEPQERELITTLLTRLQSAAGQPKDPEADALIRQAMTQIPDAPYYLVQTVLIQDLSLHNAQNRIAELEKQAASLAPPQQQPTSFLGGLFGRSQGQPAAAGAPPSGPWTRAPQAAPPPPPQYAQQGYAQPGYAQPGYAQPAPAAGMFGGGGNSFLRSAATTAAGVAGGALLFEGISSLFGHGFAGGLGGFGGGMGMGGMGMGGGISETVINNNYGGDQGGYAGGDGGYAGGGDSGGYAGGDGGYAGGDGGYAGGGDSGGYDGGGSDGGGYDSGDSGGGGDSSSSC